MANIADVLAQGIRSPALLERLQAAESELERLRAASKVIDVEAVLAAITDAVARYFDTVARLGDKLMDIQQGREIIRSVAGRIPVRPGPDGVPIAELSLKEEMPLAAAGGSIQIGVVAGGRFELYSTYAIRVPVVLASSVAK